MDVQISKRAALVGIFLFKELGVFSGFLVVAAVLFVLGCLVLALSPILILLYCILLSSEGESGLGTRIVIVKIIIKIYDVIYAQLEILG